MRIAFIYCDDGSSLIGVMSLLIRIRQHLGIQAEVIDAKRILNGGLTNSAMLIMPGGRDLPYCAKLNGKGNQIIREFVAQGGCYVGICAGAYYGCRELNFRGKDYSVVGSRELAFFDGTAQGCLPHFTAGNAYDEGFNSKAMLEIVFPTGHNEKIYYHGGCTFLPNPSAKFEPIAHYPDGSLAVVAGKFGKGNYLLSGVHFELEETIYHKSIVNLCKNMQERQQEIRISQHFDKKYGLPIWQAIRKILH